MIREKKLLLFVVIFLLISMNYVSAFAFNVDDIQRLSEIDLPEDLNFTVNETCSEHAYFLQATANEGGCFAIYSLHVNPNDARDFDFDKVYIDIYNSDGTFSKELSFFTSQGLTVEVDENTINIYFYTSMLVYDLTTQELSHYDIPDGAAENSGKYKRLRSKEFTVGKWTYSCEKGASDGYTKLIRSNGEQTQLLVEMPGTLALRGKYMFGGISIGVVITAISLFFIIKRYKNTRGRLA